jgi:SAM-dependent methyltransferase
LSQSSIKRIRSLVTRPMSDNFDALSWHYHQAEYFVFTRRLSLDFDGFIPREQLVATSAEALANSHNYKRYTNFHMKRLLREGLRTGIPFTNFVDVGCGKGHPCIIARKYFGFANVYGVDFSAPLIDIANQNLAKTGYGNVHFLVADATTWKLPDGDSLVLLNNPFNEVIVEKFLTSNLDHFRKYRSLIAYGNDLHRSTVCRAGFEILYRSIRYEQSILRYSNSPTR